MTLATPYGHAVKVHPLLAARPEDLTEALHRYQPIMIHFVGEGSQEDGILFRADDGGQVPVNTHALCMLLKEAAPHLTILLVSACWSVDLARQASNMVGCGIGMTGVVDDAAARRFSIEFYQAIGFGKSAGQAFRAAKWALATYGLMEHEKPRIFERDQGYADQLYIIHARVMRNPPRDSHKPGAGLPLLDPERKYGTIEAGAPRDEREIHAMLAAYRRYLLSETLRAWIKTSTWKESRRFFDSHPTLHAPDVLEILAALDDSGHNVPVQVHVALLILIHTDGVDIAYGYLNDRQNLDAGLHNALDARSPQRLGACATIEELVHDQSFLAGVHRALAAIINGERVSALEQLAKLAAAADPADRNRAAAQVTELLRNAPDAAGPLTELLATILTQPGT